MRTQRVGITFAFGAALLLPLLAQKLDVQLQRAIERETVTGDLKAAIAEYKRIAGSAGSDRAVAAKALVHEAECYQKMGDEEARKIYEQVVRDYGDQKEAFAEARARLGYVQTGRHGIVTRQVWTQAANGVSPDGRYLTYSDQKTGNLGLHDLKTGEDRLLTNTGNWGNEPEYASAAVFSPDGKQAAYYWEKNAKDRETRIELRVVPLDGSAPPRVLFFNSEIWVVPQAWSNDGKWIAVLATRKDKTRQIGLIAATDGSLRVLKSVDWRGAHMAFSPDSRYLSYDTPADERSVQRDIFILALDGSRESPAVVHAANDVTIGWTPDQKYLLFRSDRSGRPGVWALPFLEGKVTGGTPLPVSTDAGQTLGLTRSGALFYAKPGAFADVYLAAVDFKTGKILRATAHPIEQTVGFNYGCELSKDGKHLEYFFMGSDGEVGMAVRSMANGETRVVPKTWSRIMSTSLPTWAPDGRSLITSADDAKGRRGVFRIDAESGALEQITSDDETKTHLWLMWAPDGKSFFSWRTLSTWQWDLASGTEREVFPAMCRSVSPDGRYLACHSPGSSKESKLLAVPVAGGEPRVLANLAPDERLIHFTSWTPDSRTLVYATVKGSSTKADVWVAPLEGGQPLRVDLTVSSRAGRLSIHPDGNQVIYTDVVEPGSAEGGIFVMENILSALSTARR